MIFFMIFTCFLGVGAPFCDLLPHVFQLCLNLLDLDDFSASNGWLQAWQKRHSVKWAALCGEAADVPEDVVAHWATRLPDLLSRRLQR